MADDSKTSIFRKESLERLSSPEQLDQLMQVVGPRSWLPLTALSVLMILSLIWSIFGRIPVTATSDGLLVRPTNSSDQLIGIAFFDRREGDRIQPGMSIMMIPDAAGSEQSGGILGRVKSIASPSITTLDTARQTMLSNAASLANEPVEVVIELERDPTNPSRYRWSSQSGADLNIAPGTPTTVRITLEEKAPIRFVLPFL
jgi:hypothetical protein